MNFRLAPLAGAIYLALTLTAPLASFAKKSPIQVYVLTGDEHVLENGLIEASGKPGTLEDVLNKKSKYAPLKNASGEWVVRKDVVLYDSHPIHNNTKAPAKPIELGVIGRGGADKAKAIGVDLMLSHRLGAALDEPVLIIRHATKHPIWFRTGSRDLAHDFRPPSSGGGADHEGSWDVIHFNHGIHDTAYRDPKNYSRKDEERFPICIPIDEYEENLRAIVAKLKKTGATLIWARTTPVMDKTPGWKTEDIDRYNAVADAIMKENGVILNDLHGESIRQGNPKRPDVHSVGKFAPKVTEAILDAIAERKQVTKPLPRVLFIGDSITGTYWEKVKKNLDGKAYVCKNPTNGGHSRYGRESLDQWIDLDTYRLNGEEYLQLTHGVRDALKDLDHYCPQFADRGAELAGVIWFHGEADSQSPSKAEAYETHLANLIRDLRKDFNDPDLPVVVAALARSDGKMNKKQQQVFDAQMAVGDPGKYPEFAGNVISIDTRAMAYPKEESPGGRDRYNSNARSYLEIGNAMAEAMLHLR